MTKRKTSSTIEQSVDVPFIIAHMEVLGEPRHNYVHAQVFYVNPREGRKFVLAGEVKVTSESMLRPMVKEMAANAAGVHQGMVMFSDEVM